MSKLTEGGNAMNKGSVSVAEYNALESKSRRDEIVMMKAIHVLALVGRNLTEPHCPYVSDDELMDEICELMEELASQLRRH